MVGPGVVKTREGFVAAEATPIRMDPAFPIYICPPFRNCFAHRLPAFFACQLQERVSGRRSGPGSLEIGWFSGESASGTRRVEDLRVKGRGGREGWRGWANWRKVVGGFM